MKTVGSGQITITDLTDGDLVLNLTSNLGRTQLYNSTTGLSPDWEKTNLVLTPTVTFKNETVNLNSGYLSIVYTKQINSGDISNIDGTTEVFNSSTKTLTVNKNNLTNDNSETITYFCTATYNINNKTFSSKTLISFSLLKDGTNGINGANGTSSYFYVRYSASSDGSDMTTAPTSTTQYMGVCSTSSTVAPTDKTQYTWTKVKGENGENGSPGAPGENGQSSYLHIKYSNNGTSFTDNNGETLGTYIGTLVDFVEQDSSTFSDYTWKKFVGEDSCSLDLYSSSYAVPFDKDNNPKDSTDITLTAVQQNFSSNVTWSTSPAGITLGSSGLTRTLSVSNFKNNNSIKISISSGSFSDTVTIVKVQDGAKGTDGTNGTNGKDGTNGTSPYAVVLTNEAQTIYAENDGSVSSSEVSKVASNVKVFQGTTEYSASSDASSENTYKLSIKSQTPSIGATINSGKDGFTATSIPTSSNSGEVVLLITFYDKTEITKTFSWSKSIKGNTGANGSDSYTLLLSNENYTFAGSSEGALASSVTTTVAGYKGVTQQSITIKSVNGKTVSTSDTETGITGLKFKVSTTSAATSPTITFTSTTALTSVNGSLPIVIQMDGQNFTKTFSYSVSKAGEKGEGASLVTLTSDSQVFKSIDGGVTFSPDTIQLTPRFENCSYDSWYYSTNGTTWTEIVDPNSETDKCEIDSDTKALTIYKDFVGFDDKTTVTFKCFSTVKTVFDTMTVIKLSDMGDLQIGGANLLKYSAFANLNGVVSSPSDAYTISIDTDNKYNNNNSLKIVAKTFIKTKWVAHSTWITPTVNNNLYFTCYVKGSYGNMYVFCDSGILESDDLQQYTVQNTNEWQKVTINLGKVIKEQTSFTLHYGFTSGTYYLNSPKLEYGTIGTSWSPAAEDAISDLDSAQEDLKNQIDGKIQTYDQTADPSTSWTTEEYINHTGDLWYNRNDNITYRWNGSSWQSNDVLAESAKTLAQSKGQVFTTEPFPPYNVGDLWVDDETNVYYCITARTEKEQYSVLDWETAAQGKTQSGYNKNLLTTRINPVEDWDSVNDETIVFDTDYISSVVTDTINIYRANINSFKINVNQIDSSSYDNRRLRLQFYLKTDAPTTITFSCYMKTASQSATVIASYLRLTNDTYTASNTITTEWKRYTFTLTVPDTYRIGGTIPWSQGVTTSIRLGFDTAQIYYMTMPKLEEGDVATAWDTALSRDELNHNANLIINENALKVSFNNMSQNIQLKEVDELASLVIQSGTTNLLTLNTNGLSINDSDGSPLMILNTAGLTLNPAYGKNKITLDRSGLVVYDSQNQPLATFVDRGLSLNADGKWIGDIGWTMSGDYYGLTLGLGYNDDFNREFVGLSAKGSVDGDFILKLWYTRGNALLSVNKLKGVPHIGVGEPVVFEGSIYTKDGFYYDNCVSYFPLGHYSNYCEGRYIVGPRSNANQFLFRLNNLATSDSFRFQYGTSDLLVLGYDGSNSYGYIDVSGKWLTVNSNNVQFQDSTYVNIKGSLDINGVTVVNNAFTVGGVDVNDIVSIPTYPNPAVKIGTCSAGDIYRIKIDFKTYNLTLNRKNTWDVSDVSPSITTYKSITGMAQLETSDGTAWQPIPRVYPEANISYNIGIGDLSSSTINVWFGSSYTYRYSGFLIVEYIH
jgi:hypothetical protein